MSEQRPIHLSIIIPAYNEADRIMSTLQKIDSFLVQQPYVSEVIVVDDGSSDQTGSLVKGFIEVRENYQLIQVTTNRGKGHAVKTGMLAASGQFRLFSDADLSTPIEELTKLFHWIKGGRENNDNHDIVIASRRLKGARLEKRQPFYRELSGRIFSALVRSVAFGGYLDTQCGFKLFTAAAAKDVFSRQQIPGFGFDVEILYIALKKLGLTVKETPVTWIDSPNTKVRLFKDSLQMFFDLQRIKQNNLDGAYD